MIYKERHVRIVLVRPRNPLNIGAAARAMANFGFEDLVLVAPHEPVLQETRAAVGAEKLLREARVVRGLPEAIEDRTLVIGTSSLSRRQVTQQAISLDELPRAFQERAGPDRVAVVFGSEKTGLGKSDLDRCHWVARIPTIPGCPSMNLGQAVAVCCYELRRSQGITANSSLFSKNETVPRASAGDVERLVEEIERLARANGKSAREARLRRMLLRWPITQEDITLILGVLRDLSWQLRRKP